MYPSGTYEFLLHFFFTILYQFFKWLILEYTFMYIKYYGITDITHAKDAVLPETSSAPSKDLIPVQEPPLPSHTQSDTGIQ